MGVYVIWKFSKQKQLAKKFLIDQQLAYRDHFVQSKFYNFPGWLNGVPGGFKTIRKLTAADQHKPKGKYSILATIAERYTTNAGHPGFSNAAIGEIFDTFLIPQHGGGGGAGARRAPPTPRRDDKQFKTILKKWKDRKLV